MRKRLQLNRIKNDAGDCIENINFLAEKVIRYFQDQFTQGEEGTNFKLVIHIPENMTKEDNEMLNVVPTMEEVRHAIFSLKKTSTCGSDGLPDLFYQHC